MANGNTGYAKTKVHRLGRFMEGFGRGESVQWSAMAIGSVPLLRPAGAATVVCCRGKSRRGEEMGSVPIKIPREVGGGLPAQAAGLLRVTSGWQAAGQGGRIALIGTAGVVHTSLSGVKSYD